MFTLLLERGEAPPASHPITTRCTAGGSEADGLLLAGAPASALLLLPCGAGVVVEAASAGVRVAGHVVDPGRRRLLRPGERLELTGHAARLEATPTPGVATRALAAALIQGAEPSDAAPRGAHLLILTGPGAGRRFALPAGPAVVGRGRRASIRLSDPLVSRAHARVGLSGCRAMVEDLGAKNGLTVNGVPVERRRPAPLHEGDELGVGETRIALVLPPRSGGGTPDAPARARPPGRGARGPLAAAALLAVAAVALAVAGS